METCHLNTVRAGGAYDTVPEVCIILALLNNSEKFYPIVFDEAGACLTLCIAESFTNGEMNQVTVLPLNISWLHWKARYQPSISCTIVKLTPNSLVTPSLA